MPYFDFYSTDEIVAHLAEHDVSTDEFEEVVGEPERRGHRRSTGRPCCWGETSEGRYLICVYAYLDDMTLIPFTAYEVRRPGE